MNEKLGYNYDLEFRDKIEMQILGMIIRLSQINAKRSSDVRETVEKHNLEMTDFRDEDHRDIFLAISQCYNNSQIPTTLLVVAYRPERYRTNNSSQFEFKVVNCQALSQGTIHPLNHIIFILKQFVLMDFWNKVSHTMLYGNWNNRDVINVGDNVITEYKQLMDRMTSRLVSVQEDNYSIEITNKVGKRNIGQSTGISTAVPCINEFFNGGYFPGELIIIAGRPGMGKTTYALISAWEGYKLGTNCVFFSLEMPKNQLKSKIVSLETGIDYDKIKSGDLTPEQLQRVLEVNRYIEASGFLIFDKVKTIEDIQEITADHVKNHNAKIIFVDYIQRCKTRTGGKIREVITDISRELKSIAKDNYIPVVALSQLSRRVEERENKRPILSDLKESGSIEEDADIVSFLYRQAYYDLDKGMPVSLGEKFHTEFMVKKGRDLGTRTLHIYLDAINMKIYDYRFDGNYEVSG